MFPFHTPSSSSGRSIPSSSSGRFIPSSSSKESTHKFTEHTDHSKSSLLQRSFDHIPVFFNESADEIFYTWASNGSNDPLECLQFDHDDLFQDVIFILVQVRVQYFIQEGHGVKLGAELLASLCDAFFFGFGQSDG